MADIRKQISSKLNETLEYEQGKMVAFSTLVSELRGPMSVPILEHFKCTQERMTRHTNSLRCLVSFYFGECPSPKVKDVSSGMPRSSSRPGEGSKEDVEKMMEWVLETEIKGLHCYKDMYNNWCCGEGVNKTRKALPYGSEKTEYTIRHIMIDMEEHVAMLQVLCNKPPRFE